MAARAAQVAMQYKGQTYSGIYSVSGNLMIARIPGLDSRSREVNGANEATLAKQLCEEMLKDAERAGLLTS